MSWLGEKWALRVNASEGCVLDVELALVNLLRGLVDGGEVVEGDKGHLLVLAVGDEICSC